MRVRHTETRAQFTEPSVNFYRTIALSFLIITIGLLAVIVFITSKKATITILAKEDAKNVNITVGLLADGSIDNKSIAGSVSSSVVSFSQKYFPTGSKTIVGQSGGEVTVFNKTNESQILVKTTRLLSTNNILFRLSDRILVPANGSIVAKVYADKTGAESDIGPSKFTIPGLSEDKQKLIFAESTAPMTSGERKVGVLTEEDIKAANQDFSQKIVEQYSVASEDPNTKKVVSVLNSNPAVDKKLGDEIESFTLSGTSTVVLISYDKNDLDALISKVASSQIDNSLEKILSITNEPKVAVASYDVISKTAQLSVVQNVLVTLDANAEKLSPQYFMDKTKNEIERYIFELNHVAGVQVKFSPSWINKAPAVPDKIKVIVKNVDN